MAGQTQGSAGSGRPDRPPAPRRKGPKRHHREREDSDAEVLFRHGPLTYLWKKVSDWFTRRRVRQSIDRSRQRRRRGGGSPPDPTA